MAYCGKQKDVEKICDTVAVNLDASLLAVRLEALSFTENATNKFLLDAVTIIDPDTAAYPLEASDYYPVKVEWFNNSVNPNYEVVENANLPDTYRQIIGKVVISDSETADGKANVKALNSNLWAIIAPIKGAGAQTAVFHVFGIKNGLKFLPEATAAEFGNRVVGSFASITGAEEATPNGVNLLATDYATTAAQYAQRFDPTPA